MRGTIILLALGALSTTAAAQTPDTRIDQVRPNADARSSDSDMSQVGERSTELPVVERPAAPARPVTQVSATADSRDAPRQLTQEKRTTAALQPYGGKTARASDPLSRPSEGRTGTVTRVNGNDRCDRATTAHRPDVCARVIETRAAEFVQPDPLRLSPEQRLLVDQQLREAPSTRMTARRADDRELDSEAADGQAIAAVALGRQAPADTPVGSDPTLPDLPDAPAAVIEALFRNAGAIQPR